MKDRDITSAFDNMTSEVDGKRTVNMVLMSIRTRKSQRHINFLHKGIVTVCIIFSLAISAGAYAIHKHLSIKTHVSGPFDYIVQVNIDEKVTNSSTTEMIVFSDALLTELENYRFDASSVKSIYESGKIFNSWEDAALWLECDLLTNKKLEGIPKNVNWGGEIVLVSIYSPEGNLRCIQLTGTNNIIGEDTSCQTTVVIPISGTWEQYGIAVSQSYEVSINENGAAELNNNKASGSTTVTSFITKYGTQAHIAVVKSGNLYNATGYYIEKGIIYSFSVNHEVETVAVDLVKLIIENLGI